MTLGFLKHHYKLIHVLKSSDFTNLCIITVKYSGEHKGISRVHLHNQEHFTLSLVIIWSKTEGSKVQITRDLQTSDFYELVILHKWSFNTC